MKLARSKEDSMLQNGHEFELTPAHLKKLWCRKCNEIKRKIETFNRLKEIAKRKNGTCLTKEYVNRRSKLKWKCERGHEFQFSSVNLLNGNWCYKCKRIGNREKTLESLNAIAAKRGGKCLAKKYVHKDIPLEWQCEKGHKFLCSANKAKNCSGWCTACTNERNSAKRRKYKITELKQLAKSRGGRLLSVRYSNILIPITWQCAKGHIWNACIDSVIRRNSWCRLCHLEKIKRIN